MVKCLKFLGLGITILATLVLTSPQENFAASADDGFAAAGFSDATTPPLNEKCKCQEPVSDDKAETCKVVKPASGEAPESVTCGNAHDNQAGQKWCAISGECARWMECTKTVEGREQKRRIYQNSGCLWQQPQP